MTARGHARVGQQRGVDDAGQAPFEGALCLGGGVADGAASAPGWLSVALRSVRSSGYRTLAELTGLGSQTGSQRQQTPSHIRPRGPMVSAARSLIRPHPATCNDSANSPENRKAGRLRGWKKSLIQGQRDAVTNVKCDDLRYAPLLAEATQMRARREYTRSYSTPRPAVSLACPVQ